MQSTLIFVVVVVVCIELLYFPSKTVSLSSIVLKIPDSKNDKFFDRNFIRFPSLEKKIVSLSVSQ